MSQTAPMGLFFEGQKEGSNLGVSFELNLPASTKELDEFVRSGKRYTGAKELEVAPNLYIQYVRGGNKAVMKYEGKTTVYDSIEQAIDEYFNVAEDETLIYEDTEEGMDDESEGGDERPTE